MSRESILKHYLQCLAGMEAQLLEITGPERPQARGSRKSSDCPC